MNNKGRISLIELTTIIVICIEALFLICGGFDWLNIHVSTGNDANYLNTCESVAKVNSLNGMQCPVNGCSNSNGKCIHYFNGTYTGYFDSVSNTIIGTKPSGYNSSKNPKIDDKSFSGDVGTMVIKVIVKDETLSYEWVGVKS